MSWFCLSRKFYIGSQSIWAQLAMLVPLIYKPLHKLNPSYPKGCPLPYELACLPKVGLEALPCLPLENHWLVVIGPVVVVVVYWRLCGISFPETSARFNFFIEWRCFCMFIFWLLIVCMVFIVSNFQHSFFQVCL